MRSTLRRWAAPTFAALAALAAPGCGERRTESADGGASVRVSERDFRISAPKQVAAGELVMSVENRGPDDHELIVAREGRKHLPFRADGITIDEEAAEQSIVGALEPGEPGTRRLRVKLTPGRYVLFCNMSGHYGGGMERELEVR